MILPDQDNNYIGVHKVPIRPLEKEKKFNRQQLNRRNYKINKS